MVLALLALSQQAAAALAEFNPVEDSYTDEAVPDANDGTNKRLRGRGIGSNSQQISFMKFNVSGTSDISKVTLDLYANTAEGEMRPSTRVACLCYS